MIFNLSILLRRGLCVKAATEAIQDAKPNLCKIAGGPKEIKKSISVAIIGKANTGKSTLINAMMGMNICAASMKPQTTIEYQRVFNVEGDTEIVLLDTPGIVTPKEIKKFDLKKKTDVFQIKQVKTVDLVGVLFDASDKYSKYILPTIVKQMISTFPSKTEMVLILNKVDLVKNKFILLKCIDKLCNDLKSSDNINLNKRIFTRIFMISALNNDGVDALVQYIRSVAHEKGNRQSSKRLSSLSDSKIVEQRIRAALLQYLSHNIPYRCSCTVDYLEENVLGRVNIIAVIKVPSEKTVKKISSPSFLERITFECEEDLKKVFGKPVLLRLKVIEEPKNKK